MAEQVLKRFEQFLDRIIGISNLELTGGKLANAFLQEAQRSMLILTEFIEAFSPRWTSWKLQKGKHVISPFIGEYGHSIFKIWLSFVYPFNYRQLDAECVKGGSMVDSQGFIQYAYTPAERQIIKKICEKYKVSLSEQDILRLLITNAVKSLDPTISKIIETNYRLFIDKINLSEENNNVLLKVEIVGRIG